MSLENVVALIVTEKSRAPYGVLAWGRVLERVDSGELAKAYLRVLNAERRDGAAIELCESLAQVSRCRYFFEGLFDFAIHGVPHGRKYERWRRRKAKEYADGVGDFYVVGAVCHAEPCVTLSSPDRESDGA